MNGGLGERLWGEARYLAALFAVAPQALGGVSVRAGPGPVRDAWLEYLRHCLPETAFLRVPATVSLSRLVGGLDLAATLQAGRPVAEEGLLARGDGGVLCLAMAERAAADTVAQLCQALDSGEVLLEREGLQGRYPASFGLVALDEGVDAEEAVAASLLDRMAFQLDLHEVSVRDLQAGAADEVPDAAKVTRARASLPGVACPDEAFQALCATALALGCDSLRGSQMAVRVARVSAALRGLDTVDDRALDDAVRLVLAPRATRIPQLTEPESDTPEPPEPPPETEGPESAPAEANEADDAVAPDPDDLEERLLEAAQAALPEDLLARLRAELPAPGRAASAPGASGAQQRHRARGRPVGTLPGLPRDGARLNILATLRAAAPWQRLRREAADAPRGDGLVVRREDFRLTRYRQRAPSTTIFLLDASGSAALHRLAEAKGAVELLLADCYVRRDEVSVVAFRGDRAELLLPPTRSLTRAKRDLAALPGGGATPLASAIQLASELVQQVRRRGGTPLYVMLTDGRANVALDGSRSREAGWRDASQAARQLRGFGAAGLVIDTSPRPRESAAQLAGLLGVTYLPLPHADAAGLREAVRVVEA